MTVFEALAAAADRLQGKVESPEVDAQVLLGHVLGMSRAAVWAGSSGSLARDHAEQFSDLIARRAAGEPLQYLTGVQSFRHIELAVGPGTLVPRPETELLVEHALARIADLETPLVVDVGTGSGAIALSIARERPDAEVWATDVSEDALEWARLNAGKLGLGRVTIMKSDLFEDVPRIIRGSVDLVISNPPYLTPDEHAGAREDVRLHEPHLALVGGDRGVEFSQRLVASAGEWMVRGAWIVLETGPGIAEQVRTAMSGHFGDVGLVSDMNGLPRVVEGRKP